MYKCVEKRVLRRQTKKRTTYFYQLCARERERAQQFNKKYLLKSSAETHQSLESNGVEIHEYERIEGLQAEENTFSERKLKAEETPVENHTKKKYAKLTAEDWEFCFEGRVSMESVLTARPYVFSCCCCDRVILMLSCCILFAFYSLGSISFYISL